jgi:hypothetical protein
MLVSVSKKVIVFIESVNASFYSRSNATTQTFHKERIFMADFGRLMSRIDSREVSRIVVNPILMLHRSFHLDRNTVSSYPEFVEILVRFMRHVYSGFYRTDDFPEEMAFGRALELMKVNSLQLDYYNASTGNEGGVDVILNRICENLIKEVTRAYVNSVLDEEVDPFDYDSILELMREYVKRFKDHLYLPMRSPEALVSDWRSILISHSETIARVRRDAGDL